MKSSFFGGGNEQEINLQCKILGTHITNQPHLLVSLQYSCIPRAGSSPSMVSPDKREVWRSPHSSLRIGKERDSGTLVLPWTLTSLGTQSLSSSQAGMVLSLLWSSLAPPPGGFYPTPFHLGCYHKKEKPCLSSCPVFPLLAQDCLLDSPILVFPKSRLSLGFWPCLFPSLPGFQPYSQLCWKNPPPPEYGPPSSNSFPCMDESRPWLSSAQAPRAGSSKG